MQFDTKEGRYLSNVPVSDVNDKKSNLISVAVNANDQIIAGHDQNTISIHYADGTLISKLIIVYMNWQLLLKVTLFVPFMIVNKV